MEYKYRGKEEENENNEQSYSGNFDDGAVALRVKNGVRREENRSDSKEFFEIPIAREQSLSLDQVRWLTTSEAADYLRVSRSAIKTMVYRGQVRAHKLGRRNRFLRDELERLITIPSYR